MIHFAVAITFALYLVATMFLVAQGLHSLWMLRRFYKSRHPVSAARVDQRDAPTVLVQLPVYNERHVVERLVDAVGRLDWPKDRLRIQLLDDSTDDSASIGSDAIARLVARGVQAVHLRRSERTGFKAGALEHGLALDGRHALGPAPFIAIFDADFVPDPDFLTRGIGPLLSDATLAFVQSRWEHLNADESSLTASQAIGIDGHFAIEQAARAWSGLALNFNGTCGIWRREAIETSGGWQHDTLTEDLDLSYRAHLAGWRAEYLADLPVRGELPSSLDAWRSQQFRWAKGSIQTARKLLPRVWRSRWSSSRKLAATLHLTHYFIHPCILVSLMFAPFAALTIHATPVLSMVVSIGLAVFGVLPPLLLYVAAQIALGRPLRRLRNLPALMALGTGITWSNSVAAWQAIRGRSSDFVRTPKRGTSKTGYRAAAGYGTAELALAAWGVLGLFALATRGSAWFAPILALYVVGLGTHGVRLLEARVREACVDTNQTRNDLIRLTVAALGCIVATALIAGANSTWRSTPTAFVVGGAVMAACYMAAMRLTRSASLSAPSVCVVVVTGIILQGIATFLPMSDDVARYFVEGKQIVAGVNSYTTPPGDPKTNALVLAPILADVNHAQMTSIYPPMMLLWHGVIVGLFDDTAGFRFAAVAANLATIVVVLVVLLRTGRHPALVLAFAWNPVTVLFIAGEAHHDSIAAFALTLAIQLSIFGRSKSALILGTIATLLKPFSGVGLLFLLAAGSWRAIWIPIALACVGYAPFVDAEMGLVASALEFGGAMHFHGALEPIVRASMSPFLAPDKLALGVRAVLMSCLALGLAWLAARSSGEPLETRIARAVALLLLLVPTLHPWYFMPLVSLLPFSRSWALAAWTAASVLYYAHGYVMPDGEPWRESIAVTAAAHLPFLFWMVHEARRRRRIEASGPGPGSIGRARASLYVLPRVRCGG